MISGWIEKLIDLYLNRGSMVMISFWSEKESYAISGAHLHH